MINKTFEITSDRFNWLEYHLRNGLEFENVGDCDTVDDFSMHLMGDLYLEVKVVNAKTEDGGAYVDPVIMQKSKTEYGNSCFNDYLIMDVLDSLTSFEFEFNELAFRVSPEILETLDK
jgi:hypothetical protein